MYNKVKQLGDLYRAARFRQKDLAVLVRVAPFMCYIVLMMLSDWLTHVVGTGVNLNWLYPVRVVLVAILLLMWRKSYTELWPAQAPSIRHWMLATGFGIVTFAAWISLDAGWMMLGPQTGFIPRNPDGLDVPWIALRIAGATLVVPVMEELFWRSLMLRWLQRADFLKQDPGRVGWVAFALVTVLFGLEHNLWLAGMLAAVVFNMLYMISRNLWVPVLSHALTNALLGVWIISTGHWEFW